LGWTLARACTPQPETRNAEYATRHARPLTTHPTPALERRGNTLKGFKDFCLKSKAGIWHPTPRRERVRAVRLRAPNPKTQNPKPMISNPIPVTPIGGEVSVGCVSVEQAHANASLAGAAVTVQVSTRIPHLNQII